MRDATRHLDHHSGHPDLAKEDEDDGPAQPGHGEEVLGPAVEGDPAAEAADEAEGGPPDGNGDPDVQTRRAELIQRALAAAALVLSGVSLLASLVVVSTLRKGLAQAEPDHTALLLQVNPWYAAAIGTFLAGLSLLVVWGVLRVRRAPSDRQGPGAVPAGVGLAFAGLAWAFSFYRNL